MMGVLFNPSGRLSRAGFVKGALLLIMIGAVVSLISAVNVALLVTLGAAYLLLLYPWAVIWIKRLHDAGKSGWLFLVALVIWLIVSNIASWGVGLAFGERVTAPPGEPVQIDFLLDAALAAARATIIPGTIVQALISLAFVYAANGILPPDPGANRFGPPPEI